MLKAKLSQEVAWSAPVLLSPLTTFLRAEAQRKSDAGTALREGVGELCFCPQALHWKAKHEHNYSYIEVSWSELIYSAF